MLIGHSEFFLSQPSIYFGVLGLSQNDPLENFETQADFQFNLSCSYYPPFQPKTGMYIDWYDLPNY